jgi:thiol-disulfide isomerase/thioredoxin
MDRLLNLIGLSLLCLLFTVPGCGKDGAAKAPTATTGRTAGVAVAGGPAGTAEVTIDPKLLAGFCDKHWPGSGPDVRPFGVGPVAKALDPKADHKGRWRWINFWATWCKPCLEEMPMLGRWRDALVKEGHPFALELWSVDEDTEALNQRIKQGVPGPVWHVASAEPLGDYLEGLGLAREAVLPIQMLVDPKGNLRCARLGSVRPPDYGKVRKLVGR